MDRELIDKCVNDIAKMQWWNDVKARRKAYNTFPEAKEQLLVAICEVAKEVWEDNVEFKKTAR